MHELCPIRGREAEVALSLDTPFAELLPGVVIEFDCGATAALAKRRRQTPQAAEAFSRLLAQLLENGGKRAGWRDRRDNSRTRRSIPGRREAVR